MTKRRTVLATLAALSAATLACGAPGPCPSCSARFNVSPETVCTTGPAHDGQGLCVTPDGKTCTGDRGVIYCDLSWCEGYGIDVPPFDTADPDYLANAGEDWVPGDYHCVSTGRLQEWTARVCQDCRLHFRTVASDSEVVVAGWDTFPAESDFLWVECSKEEE